MDSQDRTPEYYRIGSSERQTPSRRRRKKKRSPNGCGGALVYLLAVVLISIVLSVIVIFVTNDVFALVKDESTIQFTVEENTKISKLSGELDKEGIVNYGLIFKLFLTVTNKNEDVLAGTYERCV